MNSSWHSGQCSSFPGITEEVRLRKNMWDIDHTFFLHIISMRVLLAEHSQLIRSAIWWTFYQGTWKSLKNYNIPKMHLQTSRGVSFWGRRSAACSSDAYVPCWETMNRKKKTNKIYIYIYSWYVLTFSKMLTFRKCWLFKMPTIASWNIHRNSFHAPDPAIRPYYNAKTHFFGRGVGRWGWGFSWDTPYIYGCTT